MFVKYALHVIKRFIKACHINWPAGLGSFKQSQYCIKVHSVYISLTKKVNYYFKFKETHSNDYIFVFWMYEYIDFLE